MNTHIEQGEYDLGRHQMTLVDAGDASIPVQDEERSQFLETAELVGLSMPPSSVMFATAIESHKCSRENAPGPISFDSSVTADYAANCGASRKRPYDLLQNTDVYLSGENSATFLFPQLNRESISAGCCTENTCQEGSTDFTSCMLGHTTDVAASCCGERQTESRAYLLRCLSTAVQCSAVQCSAVQCSVVQCGAVWCSVVQCGAVSTANLLCPSLNV